VAICGLPVSGLADRRHDSPQHEDPVDRLVLGELPDGHRQAGHVRAPCAPLPQDFDQDRYRALREFKAYARERGLVEEYESLEQFREKFSGNCNKRSSRTFDTVQRHRTIGLDSQVSARSLLPMPMAAVPSCSAPGTLS
jgi:hypothetical protein